MRSLGKVQQMLRKKGEAGGARDKKKAELAQKPKCFPHASLALKQLPVLKDK